MEKKKIDIVLEKPSHKPSSHPVENSNIQDKGEISLQTYDETTHGYFY